MRDHILLKLLDAQSESHILEYVQVRKQRIVLKYRIDLPLVGGNVVDDLAIEINRAFSRLGETGNQPQNSRLAAARRAQQGIEFTAFDFEADAF
ncbi:hypothetical protein D3C74_348480 [compost metagenome]